MNQLRQMTLVGAALVCSAAGASAQDTIPKQSLYTEAQAARGEQVYLNVCIECHEKLEYTGPDFRTKWNGKTVFDLYDLLRTTMPDENPGILSNQEYIDVVGYIMKLNGIRAGSTPLPTDMATLRKLTITIPPKPKS